MTDLDVGGLDKGQHAPAPVLNIRVAARGPAHRRTLTADSSLLCTRYRRSVEIDDAWITETWDALLGIVEERVGASAVLYVVRGDHDLGNVEAAYLAPNAV